MKASGERCAAIGNRQWAIGNSSRAGAFEKLLDVAVGVKEVVAELLAAIAMERFLVEHERGLVGFEGNTEGLQLVGGLAIEQEVPRVAGAGLLEQRFVVRGAAQDSWRAEVVGEDEIDG